MVKPASLISCWSVSELGDLVCSLAQQGYRIVNTFQTDNGMFHIVVQEF